MPPQIHTYHCLCSTLLLSTTHRLSSLPTRPSSSTFNDNAIILPLPSSPPTTSSSISLPATTDKGKAPASPNNDKVPLPPAGYTILLGLQADSKPTTIRKEDGFERRILHRCGRCAVVIGYEIVGGGEGQGDGMDIDGESTGEKEEVYKGRILYVLPGGVVSTEIMARGNVIIGEDGERESKIGEGDLEVVGRRGVGVFE